VVAFLSKLKDEAVDGLRGFDLKQTGEDCKTRIGVLRTQYNLAYLFENLPRAIKEHEVLQEKQQNKIVAFKNSQEGGSI